MKPTYASITDYLTDAVIDYLDHIECTVIAYAEPAKPNDEAPPAHTILIMSEGHERLCSIQLHMRRDQFSFDVFDSTGSLVDEIQGQQFGSAASVTKLRQTAKKHVELGILAAKARAESQSGGGMIGDQPTQPTVSMPAATPTRESRRPPAA